MRENSTKVFQLFLIYTNPLLYMLKSTVIYVKLYIYGKLYKDTRGVRKKRFEYMRKSV